MASVETTEGGRAGRRARTAVGVACAGVVVALVGLELVAPHELTLGAVDVVVVAAAFAFAERGIAIGVLGLAIAGRGLGAAVDDIPVGLAGLEVASFVAACFLVALAVDSRVLRGGEGGEAVPPAPRAASPGHAADPTPLLPAPIRQDGHIPQGDVSTPAAMRLTAREREVAALAARGLTAGQIADRLSIGRRTVETHLARAYSKLGVRSKRDLVARQLDEETALR